MTKTYSTQVKQMVAGQIINMLENNVMDGCGGESFIGWLEDGDAFGDDYPQEMVDEAMELAHEIAPFLDEVSWKLEVVWG